MKNLNKLTPEFITEFINFHFEKNDWKYNWSEPDNIAKLQAQAAAKAFNMLIEHNIALIADEVGMGKTYEALGVMSLLWRQKPNARILLYAPNEIVALKWINEYENFIQKNYRVSEDVVKSSVNNEALHKAVYCRNHIELMEQINKKWVSFFVCKTSSLSGFMSPKMNNETFRKLNLDIELEVDENSGFEERAKWMFKLANKCKEKAYEMLSEDNQPPFDLIVYDEAHYLRRTEVKTRTNRSIVANAFFAGRNILENSQPEKPLASKVLLMTATPNHSSNSDVKNIVSLFNDKFRELDAPGILKRICIRRFRRLNNKVKYEYREEIPEPVEIKTLPEKLFFAAYHKSLVLHKAKNKNSGKSNYNIMFGYLEGFEFFSSEHDKQQTGSGEEKEINSIDYETAEDTDVIRKLSRDYEEVYKSRPAHPKYNRIIDDLMRINEDKTIEKKLVFVRRIPSVNEIASRLVAEYDKKFQEELESIVGENLEKVNLREYFYNKIKNTATAYDSEDEEYEDAEISAEDTDNEGEDDLSGIPKSELYNLFTIKKEGDYKSTDCSNFRLRFKKDNQIFSIFFQPALDYKQEKYQVNGLIFKDKKRQYQTTIKVYRKDKIEAYEQKIDLNIPNTIDDLSNINPPLALETLLGIWYRRKAFGNNNSIEEYDKFNLLEKEGFSNFLENGILFASPYIFTLYGYYYKLKSDYSGDELYNMFCQEVEKNMESIGLSRLISESVLSFRKFYQKELGLRKKDLVKEKWTFLKNVVPAYPYSGHTKRPSIVRAFNTPFYPNVLIATSVLQEGVDLHYHCSEVIHYGIAWSAGDNEQRNGRVDRLFGKLHHNLKKDKNTVFPIRYPFLKNTLDQEQLQRFIYKKSEAEKLLDKLQYTPSKREYDLLERQEGNWYDYFNKPEKSEDVTDPFAVSKSDFKGIDEALKRSEENKKLSIQIANLKDGVYSIINTVKDKFGDEVKYINNGSNDNTSMVCAINHKMDNDRYQPIIIELNYYEPGIAYINKPVYFLKIKTPLCTSIKCIAGNEDKIITEYLNNPIIKINYAPKTKGYFNFYLSSELPVFMVDEKEINLSKDELISGICGLIKFGDKMQNLIDHIKVNAIDDEIKKLKKDLDSSNTNTGDKNLGQDRIPEKKREGWLTNREGIYCKKNKELSSLLTDEQTYESNHKEALFRLVNKDGKTIKEVALYKNDALDCEFELFEKILGDSKD